ncbi:Uma2 family endonuclease [Phormidesmis priestleyi]
MTQTKLRMTFEEYLAYDDGLGTRFELVKGELVPMSLGTGKHGKVTKFLDDCLNAEIERMNFGWTSQRFTVGIQSPRGNRWDTCRIPDITVLPVEQWDAMEEREAVIRAHESPPKLVIEVVSPSTAITDYRTKRTEYAVLDIPEYWIVDPIRSRVTVCTLQDGAYDDQVFQGDDPIVSATFSSLKLTTQQILSA